jgi:hypothetical protein
MLKPLSQWVTLNNCETAQEMRAARFALLSWGDRLGFKTKLPLGPVPKPRPRHNFGPLHKGNGYLLEVKGNEA